MNYYPVWTSSIGVRRADFLCAFWLPKARSRAQGTSGSETKAEGQELNKLRHFFWAKAY